VVVAGRRWISAFCGQSIGAARSLDFGINARVSIEIEVDTFTCEAGCFVCELNAFEWQVDLFMLEGDAFEWELDPFTIEVDAFEWEVDPFMLEVDAFERDQDPFRLEADTFAWDSAGSRQNFGAAHRQKPTSDRDLQARTSPRAGWLHGRSAVGVEVGSRKMFLAKSRPTSIIVDMELSKPGWRNDLSVPVFGTARVSAARHREALARNAFKCTRG
jgi:hypothetical protein